MMLNYRTSEIRGRNFNSTHSWMALVAAIVSTAWRCEPRYLHAAGLNGACPAPTPLLMCPAASWPPSTTTQPTNVSSPTHRNVNHCLLHHADWSTLRKRWAADGHQWAVINRRPGACLLVAADFLGGAERHTGALILPGFLGISNESVATTRTDQASPCTAVVNRTRETWTKPTIHVSAGSVVVPSTQAEGRRNV